MERFTLNLRRTILSIGCIATALFSNAATYTATTSGNFSAAATWGGSAPPSNVTIDAIIIPSSITVTLDQTLMVSGALSSLTVNGTLTSATHSSALIMTGGSLIGNGTITVDSMSTGLTSGFGFTGSITADNYTSTGTTLSSTATITVNNSLRVMSGLLSLLSGNIVIASNSTLIMSGGSIDVNGGSLNLTNAYNVVYVNASATAGAELSGSGLNNVEVNMPSGSSLTLSGDLDVTGTLTLTSGNLVLNNHHLTFSGNGNFAASGAGSITSTSSSNVTLMADANFTGGLRFTTGNNTVNNLAINMNNNSSAMLATDLNIAGQLQLQAGRLNIGDNMLNINMGGSISGGSSSSYVITGAAGMLTADLATGNTNTYHVGTATRYAPAVITANTGSTGGMVSVGVHESVYANGTSGTALTSPLVNATWHVASSATSNINMKLQLMWSTNMEANSFDRTKAYISHYMNNNWDVAASSSATTAANGMYTISRDNITSLSPFAVMSESSSNVQQVTSGTKITIYPNPATSSIVFEAPAIVSKVDIYSTTGQLVKTLALANNTNSISVEDLQPGLYSIRLMGENYSAVSKFVKQ